MLFFTRRQFLRAAAAASAGTVLGRAARAMSRRTGDRPPNFLFIFIDDMGWADVGYNGNRFVETPNIDKLAAKGVVFTSAYSNGPNCAPSRACLMSGQYTPRHGIYTVGSSARGKSRDRKLIPVANETVLAAGKITVAEALESAGYVCGHFGKWHLGKRSGPGSQGFDDVLVTNRPSRSSTRDAHHVRQITDRAINFMQTHRDSPFFCYVSHNTIHTPLKEDPSLVAKYRAKAGSKPAPNDCTQAAMIETLDKNVGRLLRAVDELGIADRTVVFFFSDNGGVFGFSNMGPLRGGKGMLYEGGIRVPLTVYWPGVTRPGTRCDEPVMGIDFYPTMLDMAGVSPPAGYILDGLSMVPLLRGASKLDRKAIFWHFPAYLEGNYGWKKTWRTTPAGAVRARRWKLIEFFEDGRLELYDLENDPGETRNLARQLPAKTKELHQMLRDWRRALNAPVPSKYNPEYKPREKNSKGEKSGQT